MHDELVRRMRELADDLDRNGLVGAGRLREAADILAVKAEAGVAGVCPWCGLWRHKGHAPDCLRQRALREG